MKPATVAFVFAILAVTTTWADEMPLPESPFLPIDPPAKWANAPYKGRIIITFPDPETTAEYCTQDAGKREEMGCAFRTEYICSVFVANNLGGAVRDLVVRHEEAHCRGWPRDHPVD